MITRAEWISVVVAIATTLKNSKTKYGWSNPITFAHAKKEGTCVTFVAVCLQEAGLLPSGKYLNFQDSGNLHGSIDVDYKQEGLNVIGEISWHTDYAIRQYYTGEPINHGKGEGPPHKQWAHYAESIHRKDWLLQMAKGFAEGLK